MKPLLFAVLALLPAAQASAQQCQNGQCGPADGMAGPLVPIRRSAPAQRPPVAEPENPAPRPDAAVADVDRVRRSLAAGRLGPQACEDGACDRPANKTASQPGPQGPQGPAGPAGPPGANAEPCRCDHETLQARLTAIEKQNTELNLLLVELKNSLGNKPAPVPLAVEMLDAQGNVRQRTTVIPGQDVLRFKSVPKTVK